MMTFHFRSVFLNPDYYGSPERHMEFINNYCLKVHIVKVVALFLQQEDQPQSIEEESSEELEDNAQTQPLCEDGETSRHPQA